jgi:hypothetical protein
MFYKILYGVDSSAIPRLLPLIRQFFLISNRINEFVDRKQ